MAAPRGERFPIDLVDDPPHSPDRTPPAARNISLAANLVRDVLEKPSSAAVVPPTPPTRQNVNGFPAHRKRASRFKQSREAPSATDTAVAESATPVSHAVPPSASQADSFEEVERRRIDRENRAKISAMSPEQIARERAELFSTLNPVMLQKLMKRSSVDDQPTVADFPTLQKPAKEAPEASETQKQSSGGHAPSPSKSVAFTDQGDEDRPPTTEPDLTPIGPSSIPSVTIDPPSEKDALTPDVHFPRPPQPPNLDPSSPSFLQDLHEKYFSSLPTDPSKLAWMSDDISGDEKSYSPNQESLEVTQLRFDFRGRLIPPSEAVEIPVAEGLHHHGDAPDAAGYTVPELAHLSRSKVAAQRCIAYQTLGRILYRLGHGDFGDGKGESQVLVNELWGCMERGRVFDTLEEEAARVKGHMSAKVYATEALWNWRKGGGFRPGPESVMDRPDFDAPT